MYNLARIFSLVCLPLLVGCTTYRPVVLEVSDPAGVPISGASVHAAPMYLFNPTDENYVFVVDAYDIIYPFPGEGDIGQTDQLGLVTLKIIDTNPMMLRVYAEGFIPWRGRITLSKQDEVQIQKNVSDTELSVREH